MLFERFDSCLLSFDLRVLFLDLLCLHFNLCLLFVNCVDKECAELVVFDALYLALFVVGDEQGVNGFDLFGDQAEIVLV